MRLLKRLKNRVLTNLEALTSEMKASKFSTGAFLKLTTSIDSALLNRTLSADYIETTQDADTVNDIGPDYYARYDHDHTEYLRHKNVVAATEYNTGEKPEDLALARHEHPEFYRRGFKTDQAYRLTGRIPQVLAPADHEHSEYIPRDAVVQRAYQVDGVTAEDLAPAQHEHEEYYERNETVTQADSLITEHNVVVPVEALVPVQHNHDDRYYTKKEATGLFVHDQIFGSTRELEMTYIRVPTSAFATLGASVAPGTADYSYLQAPHGLTGFQSAAVLTLPVPDEYTRETFYVGCEVHDFWVTPGSYVTGVIPHRSTITPGGPVIVTCTIRGVIPSVEVLGPSGTVEGKSEWISIYFAGQRFTIKAFDFQDAFSAIKVRALVLVSYAYST